MDTNKKNREYISALMDGEIPETDLELAMAALGGPEGQQAWDTWHHLGDVLRAEAGAELSAGFSERRAALTTRPAGPGPPRPAFGAWRSAPAMRHSWPHPPPIPWTRTVATTLVFWLTITLIQA
jgi:sigma-E factor negative regulatory protein RseA